MNPKSNAINGAQLYEKKEAQARPIQLALSHRELQERETEIGGSRQSLHCCVPVKNNSLAIFKKATGTIRASWPNESTSNELGSKCPGFPSNSFSSPPRDATFLPVIQIFAIFVPIQSFALYYLASPSTHGLCGAGDSFSLTLHYASDCLSSLCSSWSSALVESSQSPFPLPAPRVVPAATAHVPSALHTPGSPNRIGASFPPTLTCAAVLILSSTCSLPAAVLHSRLTPP